MINSPTWEYADCLKRANNLLKEELAKYKWRPIDTYYDQGRVIFSGTYEGRKWIEIGHWSDTVKFTTGSHGLLGVTHWMPLPDFPED